MASDLRRALPADFPALARLVAAHTRDPQTHCIHSSTTDEPSVVLAELERLDQCDELIVVIALCGDTLNGALGAEFDVETGRAWLRGPFIADSAWDGGLPNRLLERLLAELPREVRQLDTFLNVANTHGHAFYLRHDFEVIRAVHVYMADRPASLQPPDPDCAAPDDGHAAAVAALHDMIFPHTYLSGAAMLADQDADHHIFAVIVDGVPAGYLYASFDPDAVEGTIEFVGVRPGLRGRGIARRLLLTALHWCFAERAARRVSLTVNEELTNAQALYERVGFAHAYTGVHTRRMLQPG